MYYKSDDDDSDVLQVHKTHIEYINNTVIGNTIMINSLRKVSHLLRVCMFVSKAMTHEVLFLQHSFTVNHVIDMIEMQSNLKYYALQTFPHTRATVF